MRTRFAPSPTGMLHIGGLRTALFAYLAAVQEGGKFLLRIEDTDQARSVDGAVENILTALHWAGIDPDEGVMMRDGAIVEEGTHGPYTQSKRFDLYRKYAEELIEKKFAYYAFDTKEDLDHMRERESVAGNPAPKYDASVRATMKNSLTLPEEEWKKKLEDGDPYVIRMLIPEGNVIRFTDDIRGKVEFKGMEIDDQILIKSDGFPTYHLANVVDDHLMDINLVVRGEEWLSSTPKHLLLFEYLGWQSPRYAHVPLLLNQGGGKLSKRQNDVAVGDYIDKGYLPEAVVNFIALLGWNPGTTQEMFTMKELVDTFSLDRIQKGGAVFDVTRLDWFQGQWMRSIPAAEFAARIQPIVAEKYPEAAKDEKFVERATLIQERITFDHEAPEMLSYYYEDPAVDIEMIASKKQKLDEKLAKEMIDLLIATLEPLDDFSETSLHDVLFAVCDEKELKKGQLLWPLRAVLTGLPFSPGAFEVAAALGKEKTLSRLKKAQGSL
ncbi:MAG: glutamate--tRNA ligase [Candidatus Peribacter sp.]|jgi:glutamyl-tRNA synthetase|nr:glutamate--tRNA ligase [Candidatus Peribacter sp.]MBT4393111.1 glutamate--tRNA ligase [Candidatus Peribacter sp.]MBT4600910.1 glutamate--tRNA ligase [Candidatus Peribacter sp.]MBT5148960.1 glutamate--tRNA ligase [Candidatus Peribacter sp.]MBT5638361.1 glutamate--tRNA ligase [Candidatus Peribacter sp.]